MGFISLVSDFKLWFILFHFLLYYIIVFRAGAMGSRSLLSDFLSPALVFLGFITYLKTHTHTHEWHRMTTMTGPDCAVMCNLINTHTHTHTIIDPLIPPWEDQGEWHRMNRTTGPDWAVMCNFRNIHTHMLRQAASNQLYLCVGGG